MNTFRNSNVTRGQHAAKEAQPLMLESLEHRQMMSVTAPTTGLPVVTSSSVGTYATARPAPTQVVYTDDWLAPV